MRIFSIQSLFTIPCIVTHRPSQYRYCDLVRLTYQDVPAIKEVYPILFRGFIFTEAAYIFTLVRNTNAGRHQTTLLLS